MKLGPRSSLTQVVMCVGAALESARIHAVLTGGACANFYSSGAYLSNDADFVLTGTVTRAELDEAMRTVGFSRVRDHYRHPTAPFVVEFPAGPLAIGRDHTLRPRLITSANGRVRLLSATDSCRDRLAQFYFWRDKQGLRSAVEIAIQRRVDMTAIRSWSVSEECLEKFEQFKQALEVARRRSKGEPH